MGEICELRIRIVIFVGAFGSGKTEIALNYVRVLRKQGKQVAIVDLDIASPYFRSRDVTEKLTTQGIEVIAPPGGSWPWQIFLLLFRVPKEPSMIRNFT